MPHFTQDNCDVNDENLQSYVPEKGRIAIDAGCNVGHWTRFLVERFEHVHAVDPQAGECPRGVPRTTVHPVALWSNNGHLRFITHVNRDGSHQGAIAGVDDFIISHSVFGHFDAQCTTLDALNIQGEIDFIKMDVDGAEVEAILGAQGMLRRCKPKLLIETHTNANRAWLEVYLTQLGYSCRYCEKVVIIAPELWRDPIKYLIAEPK